MTLGRVQARFLVGVGAWLLGAGAATGGSLLAVSVLGQDLAPPPSQQLTVAAVNYALASEVAEAAQSPSPVPAVSSSANPVRPRAERTPKPAPSTPAPPPAQPAQPAPQPTATLLTSIGGTVLASCPSPGSYLDSWSPAQGFEETQVTRGPAATAKVTFTGSHKIVTMAISCSGGVPSSNTTVRPWDE